MWKRYHFSVEVCEKGTAIPLGGTSQYKTSLSTPVHFWGWNRLIRAKNQLSSIKPTYIQVCWFPGSGFVSTSSSSKYAAKLSISSIYSSNSIFLVCVRRVSFLLFLLCAQTVVWPFLWKTCEFFHLFPPKQAFSVGVPFYGEILFYCRHFTEISLKIWAHQKSRNMLNE